jgi:CDP-glycerol glycerophosphotransferase
MTCYINIQKVKEIFLFLFQTFGAFLATLFFTPLSLVVPKKRNRIVVIGRDKGFLLDNTKHFYLFLCTAVQPKPDVLFITSDKSTISLLLLAQLPVAQFPSLKTFLYLCTANIIVIDSAEWISDGKFQLTFASKKIQLWHGAPLKEIELPLFNKRLAKLSPPLRILLKAQKLLIGRYAKNSLVTTTSTFFTQNAFQKAFNSQAFLESGYPRNDSLFQTTTDFSHHIWLNTDLDCIHQIERNKILNKRIFLYMPTFRKSKECPITSGIIDFAEMDKFLNKNNSILVLKVHPVLARTFKPAQFQNILCYHPTSDIYPALAFTDCLITDYSSIYFDYLLLDKPIIFFTYDYESYIADDRKLLFDFKNFAPGEICGNQAELEDVMLRIDADIFKQKRAELREIVFNHKDGNSSSRIWEYICAHNM